MIKPLRRSSLVGAHALRAQVKAEVMMRLRHGETALLVLGIPIILLVFFSLVYVVETPTDTNVEFVFPGILALAILSTAFTSTAISTAFERAYGVLQRIGITPLGRTRLILAKIIAIGMTQVVQVVVLTALAMSLGLAFPGIYALCIVVAAGLAATSACVGIGLVLASTMKPETVLGVANGIYVMLLLLSGLVFGLDKLPTWLGEISQLLPITALAQIYRAVIVEDAASIAMQPIVVLGLWAIASPLLAKRLFRWS